MVGDVPLSPKPAQRAAWDLGKIIPPRWGWTPTVTFEEGTKKTIDWYLEQTEWLGHVVSGQYQQYYKDMYSNR